MERMKANHSFINQFQIIAWLWLVVGTLGFAYKFWHVIDLGKFIYFKAGSSGLAWEIGECVFAFAVAATGYCLVRGWRWSRVGVEVLASVLLSVSGLCLLFRDIAVSSRV